MRPRDGRSATPKDATSSSSAASETLRLANTGRDATNRGGNRDASTDRGVDCTRTRNGSTETV